nr:molybdopterin-dependent oxidoreductase [Eggerthella sinensis]
MTKDGTKVTRRGFIKGTAAAGAGLALFGAAGAMATSDEWLVPAHADSGEEYTAYTYHQSHCGGMCPLACTVRDGRMVSVQPNNCCDDRYETICVKGISEVQHIYGDHRVQTPLKRTGERGAGEFAPISWDEALDEVCDTLKELQAKHGKDCVVISSGAEANFPWLAATLGAQVDGSSGIDVGIGNGLDPAIGFGGGYAMATCEARDWVNSNLVLNVGSNFLESSLPNVRLFFEAKESGTRMVTVDPHFSTTAGKSDQWVPITPGTDAAFFLGMASVILDEQLYDEDFVLNHTSLPFLVDVSTGKLLRDHAEDPAAEEPETGEQNPFFVWDAAAGAKAPHTDAMATPALEGTFTVDGTQCTTVFSLLKKKQASYTAEWAEGVSGVPADTIRELARAYAEGPACLALGWGGNDKMGNADIAGHAAATLVALTGNVGKVGAGVGVFGRRQLQRPCRRARRVGAARGDGGRHARDAAVRRPRGQREGARLRVLRRRAAAAYRQHEQDRRFRARPRLHRHHRPVLHRGRQVGRHHPARLHALRERRRGGQRQGGLQQHRAAEQDHRPLFEARTDFWIGKEIAKRFGVDQYLPNTSDEWVAKVLSSSEDPYVSSLTIDKINEKQGVYPLEGIEEPRREFMDRVFATTSTRMDVYYDGLVAYDQALPTYEPPLEAHADSELAGKYPLQLANVRTRYRIHNQFNDAKWLQQFAEPRIELNPVEMEVRGLATGDAVEVFNDRGSYQCRVKANESIRPGSARMFEGQTADYLIEGNVQNVTNDGYVKRGAELMCGPVIPFSDTLVEIKKA